MSPCCPPRRTPLSADRKRRRLRTRTASPLATLHLRRRESSSAYSSSDEQGEATSAPQTTPEQETDNLIMACVVRYGVSVFVDRTISSLYSSPLRKKTLDSKHWDSSCSCSSELNVSSKSEHFVGYNFCGEAHVPSSSNTYPTADFRSW